MQITKEVPYEYQENTSLLKENYWHCIGVYTDIKHGQFIYIYSI